MGDVVQFARSGNFDGSEQAACPKCGNVWWKTAGIVIAADFSSVEGYAYPLTCVECETVLHPPSDGWPGLDR